MKVYICDNGCDKAIAISEENFITFVSSLIEKSEDKYCPFLDDFEEYLRGHMAVIDCFLQKEPKENIYLGYKEWIERGYSPNWTVTELL